MSDLMKKRKNRELLDTLVLSAKQPGNVGANVMEAACYHEILKRMHPDELPKTEKTFFRLLKRKERFLWDGHEYMAVLTYDPKGGTELIMCAVGLSGPYDGKTVPFVGDKVVEKVINQHQ